MNLMDALRQAEQHGKESVHRGAEKLHHLETEVRRRVRGNKPPKVNQAEPADSSPSTKGRT